MNECIYILLNRKAIRRGGKMKNYKIWILFILLSVVSFGNEGKGIDVWIQDVGITSTDPITFELVLKTRTGVKFGTPEGSIINIKIENGINNEETIATAPLVYDETKVSYESPNYISTFTVSISTTLTFIDAEIAIGGKISITDPDGNVHAINNRKISFNPFPAGPNGDIDLRVYEKRNEEEDWTNSTTGITGSAITLNGGTIIFTKGGPASFEADPGIYVIGRTGEGVGQIVELNVQRNNDGVEEIIPIPFGEKTQFTMKIGDFIKNGKNTVTIKPIGILNVEGSPETLDFVVDTNVNNSKLGDGIIGELGTGGIIEIDLTKLEELSGVKGYSYTLKVGDKTEPGGEPSVSGESYLEPSKDSTLGIVEIPTSGFIAGSKGTLLFTIYDKLGHEKIFEKTYFIPKQLEGINSKVSDEAKQRRSKIKVVTEGSSDKFGVESSMDKSSE